MGGVTASLKEPHLMVNCDNAGKAKFAFPASIASAVHQPWSCTTSVVWDTGAEKTTTPNSVVLSHWETVQGLYIKGVVGDKQPIVLQGTYYPKVKNSHSRGLTALHVPGSPYLLISISQFCNEYNAAAIFTKKLAFLWGKDGVMATASIRQGLYIEDAIPQMHEVNKYLQSMVQQISIPSKVTNPSYEYRTMNFSLESLRLLHMAGNHIAYSTLRKIYGYPPADKDHPDPSCAACMEAGIPRPNLPAESKERSSRPWWGITCDLSRKMPTDQYGHQRTIMATCEFTDHWSSLPIKRKSEFGPTFIRFCDRINNRHAPYRIAQVTCDGELPQSDWFKAALLERGIHLKHSAPNEQWQNPAESTMKRWQRALFSTMTQGNAPGGSWSFASNHVCYVHNRMPMP